MQKNIAKKDIRGGILILYFLDFLWTDFYLFFSKINKNFIPAARNELQSWKLASSKKLIGGGILIFWIFGILLIFKKKFGQKK